MTRPARSPRLLDAVARAGGDRARLRSLAWRRGVTLADAEDALHAGLARALTRADQLRDDARADAWVSRIVQTAVLDAARRRGPIAEHDVDALAIPPSTDVDCWCVLNQLLGLDEPHRRILELVVLDGRSTSEVAAALGVTPNHAAVRLHRARAALRERLRRHCGTTSVQGCDDCGCVERGCCPPP